MFNISRTVIGLALVISSFSSFADIIPVTASLTETSAYQIGDLGAGIGWTPVATSNETLKISLSIDTALEYVAYGPITYRSGSNDATITSSAAGYLLPTFFTPYSAELLTLFGSHPFDTNYSKVDVSRAYVKDDSGGERAWGGIIFSRSIAYNQTEGDASRIITYLLQFGLYADDLKLGADEVEAISPEVIRELLNSSNRDLMFMQEQALSYLERDCGTPTGCTHTDAYGYRRTWAAVPEPSVLLLLSLGGALMIWSNRKMS